MTKNFRACQTCGLHVITAQIGSEWVELQNEPELYNVVAQAVEVLGVTSYINVARKANGWKRHACTNTETVRTDMALSLADPAPAGAAPYFPPSLGEPA